VHTSAKCSESFAVEKRKNVNQSVSGIILLNKANTELSGFIKKKKKQKKNKKNGIGVVNCTYLTHFRMLQLYHINNVTWYIF